MCADVLCVCYSTVVAWSSLGGKELCLPSDGGEGRKKGVMEWGGSCGGSMGEEGGCDGVG